MNYHVNDLILAENHPSNVNKNPQCDVDNFLKYLSGKSKKVSRH